MTPPSVPEPVDFRQYGAGKAKEPAEAAASAEAAPPGHTAKSNSSDSYTDFEYF